MVGLVALLAWGGEVGGQTQEEPQHSQYHYQFCGRVLIVNGC